MYPDLWIFPCINASFPNTMDKRKNKGRRKGVFRHLCSMYYTIEGKRFLCILYVAGLLSGSIFLNISIRMNLFRTTDFLGFVEYIQTLNGLDTSAFFSYVCLIRFRQLLLFFICLFLFSPYVVYCVLDFLVSLLMGFFISTLVNYYGWAGMIKGIGFLIPHYFFYGIVLCVIYIYLFQKTPLSKMYMFSAGKRFSFIKNRKIFENKIVVAGFCLLMFVIGCYGEAYLNPGILKIFFH